MLTLILAMLVLTVAGCGDNNSAAKKNAGDSASSKDSMHKGEEEHKEGDDHDEHTEGDEHGHEEHGTEVTMTPQMIKESGIVVEAVAPQSVASSLAVPGRVVPTQGGSAHVGTIIAGRVTRLLVSEGSSVRKGAALAEIEAFDIGALKGEYMTARAAVQQTRAAVDRQQRLQAENIGAKKNLEEARGAYGAALASLRATEARLRAVGISPGSVGTRSFSSRIALRSPITGVVSRLNIALGEYLEPNRDAFEIVNTSTVWVDAQVAPAVASTLQTGTPGFVIDAEGHRHVGHIRFISPTVDPESRTVTVRTEIVNPELHIRPETFVSVEFERPGERVALMIPAEAVEMEGDKAFVYREHEPNTFQRVEIKLGARAGSRVVVDAGLEKGDRIAVAGIFYLKSALKKGELEEHHH